MTERWIVNNQNQLLEARDISHQPRNPLIRNIARFISFVIHPLFVPVYLAWFLISTQPYLFSAFSPVEKWITLARFFMMYSFFPLVTVLLAKALGFLDSIYLRTQKERIIPYIACGIYYFWMSYVLRNQPRFSHEIVQLSMAIFIASFLGLMLNINMKVSMHAISMGILSAFMTRQAVIMGSGYTLFLSVSFLVAGLVCTSRFIISDHSPREVYAGLFVGGLSQLLAVWADGILP